MNVFQEDQHSPTEFKNNYIFVGCVITFPPVLLISFYLGKVQVYLPTAIFLSTLILDEPKTKAQHICPCFFKHKSNWHKFLLKKFKSFCINKIYISSESYSGCICQTEVGLSDLNKSLALQENSPRISIWPFLKQNRVPGF